MPRPILFGLAPPFRSSNSGSGQRLGVPPLIPPLTPVPGHYYLVYGTTKTSAGVALTYCTVHLFRTIDDVEVEQTTSDGTGYYEFRVGSTSTAYYLVAYKTGSPDVAGTTVNTVLATTTASSRTTYQATILADAPRGYWRLGESSGTVFDYSGNQNNGTTSGTVTREVQGLVNVFNDDGAIDFNGSTGVVSIPSATALNLGDVLSVELWLRRDRTGVIEVPLSRSLTGAYLIGILANNKVGLFPTDSGTPVVSESGTTVDTAAHHFVFTKTGATAKAYKDGADVTSAGTNATLVDGTGVLYIGAAAGDGTQAFDGVIDEVAIYNYVLTPTQVATHYTMGQAF